LDTVGAVSQETALEMVAGALTQCQADLALAVTGIAGPDGGSAEKPVGTVFISWQRRGHTGVCVKQCYAGDRHAVRQQVVEFCLHQLATVAETET
jgi:nicotinamide-nucleotide amidase